MLDPKIRDEIEAHAARYPTRRAASLDALRIAQQHERWITDQSLRDIAELLGMDVAELEGVATFYNLVYRKPVGEHVILVCDSVSCWMNGGDALRDALLARLRCGLGETSADGKFTPIPMCCLGACEQAPVLLIEDELIGNVRPDDLDGILARDWRRAWNGH